MGIMLANFKSAIHGDLGGKPEYGGISGKGGTEQGTGAIESISKDSNSHRVHLHAVV